MRSNKNYIMGIGGGLENDAVKNRKLQGWVNKNYFVYPWDTRDLKKKGDIFIFLFTIGFILIEVMIIISLTLILKSGALNDFDF